MALAFGVSVFVYASVSLFVFHSVLAPISLLTLFASHLGAPFWPLLLILSAVVAAFVAFRLEFPTRLNFCRLPVFIGLAMLLSTGSVGAYAELLRSWEVKKFAPDIYVRSSFFQSLREAPADFQLFLHAAAVKDCKPYAWSYRKMAFYELKPDTAVNVLPQEWLQRCAIRRTQG